MNAKPITSRTWFQYCAIWIFYASIIALFYLATTHQAPMLKVSHFDKVQHGVAFGWLTLIAFFAWRHPFYGRFLMIFAIGGSIELAQMLLSHRTASGYDLIANSTGILLVELFIVQPWRRSTR